MYFIIQDDRTPLHKAAEEGHTDVVNMLIAYRADILPKDKVSKC